MTYHETNRIVDAIENLGETLAPQPGTVDLLTVLLARATNEADESHRAKASLEDQLTRYRGRVNQLNQENADRRLQHREAAKQLDEAMGEVSRLRARVAELEKPAVLVHPEYLDSLEDYEAAPVGTVVLYQLYKKHNGRHSYTKTSDGWWLDDHGDCSRVSSDWMRAGNRRKVHRWGGVSA